ncbi:MAG TPA: T9SS type A sorting domain-containing protein, partial [Ignavibacteriaceae bacterium]|nr:T9SS type A sorting domain-containing protein [Ignavibacteriaceae bacterium]
TTSVEDNTNNLPDEFYLSQNYPNPFNPSTSFKYRITEFGFVSLKVYDVLGNEIATLVNDYKPAGEYQIYFTADNLTSGTYFYRLISGSFSQTRNMIILR